MIISIASLVWWISASPGDLSRLNSYAEQLNYGQLVKRLKARENDSTNFTFVVLGDPKSKTSVASKVYERAASEDPVVIFNTGDLVRVGNVDEYLTNYIPLLRIIDPVPMFCVPGNHDRGSRRDFKAFKKLFGGERFAFDYGPCRFIGFNTSETIRVSKDDLRFLDEIVSRIKSDDTDI
ncbi:MAG: metallophosphoesterase [Deltaproteobacteria bacterium]|nr:metallophosphoesterase [Deltaproteobacteria bacterium]